MRPTSRPDSSPQKKKPTPRSKKLANGVILGTSTLMVASVGVIVVQQEQAVKHNMAAAANYTPKATLAAPEARTRITLPGEGATAVVIGDSYTQGTGADDRDAGNWAARATDQLGWDATILGIGGTGFTNGGKDGGNEFIRRIEDKADDLSPDVVVLQGGQNDHEAPPKELRDAVTATLEAAKDAWPDAKLIVVGPTAPQPLGGMLGRIATPIAQTATAEGAVSIDPIRSQWITDSNTKKYDFDGSHVNDVGHEYLAEKFVEVVERHQQ